jgi:hypothetical protein
MSERKTEWQTLKGLWFSRPSACIPDQRGSNSTMEFPYREPLPSRSVGLARLQTRNGKPLIAVLLAVACLSNAAMGQTISNSRFLAYRSLFFRTVWLREQADKQAARGRNPAHLRATIGREIGLSPEGQSRLESVAADWCSKDAAFDAQAKALGQAGQQSGTVGRYKALAAERRQALEEQISRLAVALGPMSYRVVDTYLAKDAEKWDERRPPGGRAGARP